ncbi:MAG TPA: LamG domain-containing protein, partial [Verrucomicrobiae bacterium]
SYAREFFGDTYICFTPGAQSFYNLSKALSGNFSVSAWINTTNSTGEDYYDAGGGAGVLNAYNANTNSAIPLSITGSKAAFTIYDQNGSGTTLHSVTTVNDGKYHFIAVTRSRTNGLMSLYVDGTLQGTGTNTTQPIFTPSIIYLAGGGASSFVGLLDDVRIYSGVLSPNDVATLAAIGAPTLPQALGATNLTWTLSGDTSWFVETTNTYNGAPAAAQSGSVTNYESTTLTTTVTGPGNLTFYWSSIAEDPNGGFDYEFYIDDPNTNDIADLHGDNSWQSIQQITGGPIHIPAGQHTLGWTVYANGDTDPTQAGFLDQVIFTPPDTNPVSADIKLDIYREQEPTFGDVYFVFPSFNSVTPAATGTTINSVQSPTGMFGGQADSGGGGSGSTFFSSLGQLINECTNGLWTLYINKGLPTERQFHFSASVSGLTTNLLSAVKIITPTNGATGVPLNASFQWIGPTNYSSLNVSKHKNDGSGYVSADLPLTATNWPSPPVLPAGTNQFDINYVSNSFPNMTFTVPVDTNDSQTVSSWVTHVNLHSTDTSIFVVTAGPLPTALLNPQNNGVNFQFQFLSQSGLMHAVQYRTDLTSGIWQTYSNVAGDGTLKTIPVPFSVFGPSPQGFIRVSTQ